MTWGWVRRDNATGPYADLANEMMDVIIGCQVALKTRIHVSFL